MASAALRGPARVHGGEPKEELSVSRGLGTPDEAPKGGGGRSEEHGLVGRVGLVYPLLVHFQVILSGSA